MRTEFKGTITYASGAWERVEWSQFDVIGVNYYRNKYNSSSYVKGLRKYAKPGKPLAILEFGCCTYAGAQDKGAAGYDIVQQANGFDRIPTGFRCDEAVQAQYIEESLRVFETADVQHAFVFELITPARPHSDNPTDDLDMASFALVKVYPDSKPKGYFRGYWEPKRAFHVVARFNQGGTYDPGHSETIFKRIRRESTNNE